MLSDLLEYLPSKSKTISWINMASALCAFFAALFWVLSGGLGEVTLDISDVDRLQPVAKGAAQFNTTAAKWALASALFVMLSSLFSIAMKDDSVREQEKIDRQAREDAKIDKFISDHQFKQADIVNSTSETADSFSTKGSKWALAAVIFISLLPYKRQDKG